MEIESGKTRILRVAEDLFLEKGFEGTSMNEIAEKAGVAKSLIYHHFESKKSLWQALIHDYHDRSGMLEKFYDTISADDPDTLIQMVTGKNGFFDFFRRNPSMVRLFSWLDLETAFVPDYPEESIKQKAIERIRTLQEDGWIRPDIEPGLIPIMFLSVIQHWFAARRYLVAWLGDGIPEDELDDMFIGGITKIIIRGITNDAKS